MRYIFPTRLIPIFFFFIPLFTGCGGPLGSKDKLEEAVLLFNDGVRWGRIQEVLPRVHPNAAANFIEMHKEFGREIQLSDYELIDVLVSPEKKKADVSVQITWYRQSEMVVHTSLLVQHWEEQKMEWIMASEEFRSGDPF